MPVARIRNSTPSFKVSRGSPATIDVPAGSIIGLFPYIYTYAGAFSVGTVSNISPTFSRQTQPSAVINARIFNY